MTAISPGYDREVLAGLDLRVVPVGTVTRYANSYDERGARSQRLPWAGDSLPPSLLADLPAGDVALVAPSYHELTAFPAITAPIRGLALQGLLRETGPEGVVRPRRIPWRHVERFVSPGMFVFYSVEDTADPVALAQDVAARGATCFVTAGSAGARCYSAEEVRQVPPVPALQVDPTGAGDCFATAFLIRYAECGSLATASAFAAAAGALAVEAGGGPFHAPTRQAIEARLEMVAA